MGPGKCIVLTSPKRSSTKDLLQVKNITDGLAYLHSQNVVHGDLCYVCSTRGTLPAILSSVILTGDCL